jgi:hypothetical protein
LRCGAPQSIAGRQVISKGITFGYAPRNFGGNYLLWTSTYRDGTVASLRELRHLLTPRHLGAAGEVCLVTAFLDESGTHGEISKSTVMAGFVGGIPHWEHFERRWKDILSAYPEAGIVHGKQLIPRRHPFKQWSNEKYYSYCRCILQAMKETRIEGVICAITNREHREARQRIRTLYPKLRTDSAYGMCFRACMVKLASTVRHRLPGQRVSFVVESGHKNRGDADRIFHHTRDRGLSRFLYPLGTFMPAAKENYGALQAADLIAYATHKHMEQVLSTGDQVVRNWFHEAILLNTDRSVDCWLTGEDIIGLYQEVAMADAEYQSLKKRHGQRRSPHSVFSTEDEKSEENKNGSS